MTPMKVKEPVIPAQISPVVAGNGHSPRSAPRKRRRRRFLIWIAVAAAISLLAGGALMRTASTPPAAPAPASQALTAHGIVQPVARASIATMNGGVVEQLAVQVGQRVEAQQLMARVSLPGQAELLAAPWAGTVMGLNVHLGDTLMPGTTIATIGDLSRYQVETTDLDEYLIGYVTPGQPVTMTVEALDQAQVRGFVKTVALQQQQSASASNYPVVIDLAGSNPSLRPGMTVRITFASA
jgi:multidrug efflux pump subunit AcrA (membrane-fusion protein)